MASPDTASSTPDPNSADESGAESARERTRLARERTFAAWMRTGLAAIATGVVVGKLAADDGPAPLAAMAGVVLSLAGGIVHAVGFWDYYKAARARHQKGHAGLPLWVPGVLSIAVLAAAVASAVVLLL